MLAGRHGGNPMSEQNVDATAAAIVARAQKFFEDTRQEHIVATDRAFTWLFIGQWLFAIGLALIFSPSAWEGRVQVVHMHFWFALILGGLIISLPVWFTLKRSGEVATRYIVCVSQMLLSALLIHLLGGRIETHFHVFCSLAGLAFYCEWGVLVVA